MLALVSLHKGLALTCLFLPAVQKAASVGLFGSPYKPFYYKDPSGKPFIDIDGNDCGPRWVLVDPSSSKKKTAGVVGEDSEKGCVVM